MNLIKDSTSNPEYERFIEINGNKGTIEFQGIENGISSEYIFEKINGKWYLITWTDAST